MHMHKLSLSINSHEITVAESTNTLFSSKVIKYWNFQEDIWIYSKRGSFYIKSSQREFGCYSFAVVYTFQ